MHLGPSFVTLCSGNDERRERVSCRTGDALAGEMYGKRGKFRQSFALERLLSLGDRKMKMEKPPQPQQ